MHEPVGRQVELKVRPIISKGIGRRKVDIKHVEAVIVVAHAISGECLNEVICRCGRWRQVDVFTHSREPKAVIDINSGLETELRIDTGVVGELWGMNVLKKCGSAKDMSEKGIGEPFLG